MEKHDQLKFLSLLSELKEKGYEFDYLTFKLNSRHKSLIPILIRYFRGFENEHFKDLIIGALAVKGFSDATKELLSEYASTESRILRWRIADTISIILDKRFEEAYINIIKNKSYGTTRQMFVVTLGKLRSKKALPALINLLEDEEVNGHVIVALGYYHDPGLSKYIVPFLESSIAWKRKEAKDSLKTLSLLS